MRRGLRRHSNPAHDDDYPESRAKGFPDAKGIETFRPRRGNSRMLGSVGEKFPEVKGIAQQLPWYGLLKLRLRTKDFPDEKGIECILGLGPR